jgi:hypothetical protein
VRRSRRLALQDAGAGALRVDEDREPADVGDVARRHYDGRAEPLGPVRRLVGRMAAGRIDSAWKNFAPG